MMCLTQTLSTRAQVLAELLQPQGAVSDAHRRLPVLPERNSAYTPALTLLCLHFTVG